MLQKKAVKLARHIHLPGAVGTLSILTAVALLTAACGSTLTTPHSNPSGSAGSGGGKQPGSTQPPVPAPVVNESTAALGLQDAYASIVKAVLPSVVQLQTSTGLGSGIVYNNQGDVVTNNHVVAGATTLQLTTVTGKTYTATVVGTYAPDDLAVVHVSGAHLTPASFGNSSALVVGDIVMAIGNPLGLQSSVTSGIVSATGRTESEGNGIALPDMIQTSANINPGNSGGALVDLEGQVIGIPTLAATDPQLGGGSAPGIGFAIPSSIVTTIANQIIATGHVTNSGRAYLGVEVAIQSFYNNGAVIVAVTPGGPAAKAGLQQGDIITSVAGNQVQTANDLAVALAQLSPGQTVTVQYLGPNGNTHSTSVTLGQLPGSAS